MSSRGGQDAFKEVLASDLARLIDWLKYAEAKNGALLAFASAWAVAVGNILAKDNGPPAAFATELPLAASAFLFAAVILVASFIPRINLSGFYKRHEATSRGSNLLFYGDIAAIPLSEFEVAITTRYMPKSAEAATTEYLSDLIAQIAVNSQIVHRKFKFFKWASLLTLAGMAILAWPAIHSILKASTAAIVGLVK